MKRFRLEQIEDINGSNIIVAPTGNLSSSNVQTALVELQGDIDSLNSAGLLTDANLSIGTHNATTFQILIDTGTDVTVPSATNVLTGLLTAADKTKLDGIESNAKDDQIASEVPYTPTGNLLATNVQAALTELQGDIDTINGAGYLTSITGESILSLSDTPGSYSGQGSKFLRVNSGATATEFVAASSIPLSSFDDDLSYIVAANLSTGTRTATVYPINIDTGTDINLLTATSSLAGLMVAADKIKSDYITITQAVDLDALESDVADLTTLSGVASNAVNLGLFTGTTITDNLTVKAALQELESALEANTTDLAVANRTATTLDVTSSSGTDASVPAATDSLAGLMVAADKVKSDYISITQSVDLDTLESNQSAVITLTGKTAGSTDLGTFTEDIIPDNVTITGALQALESALHNLTSNVNSFEWIDSVADKDIVTPPVSPTTGDRYLIGLDTGGSLATGAWSTHDGKVAEWSGSAWEFTTPTTGMFVSVDDEPTVLYNFSGTTWSSKNFESTTASTGLTKVGQDLQLASSSAGTGLSFSAGTLSIDLSELPIEATPSNGTQYAAIYDGSTSERILLSNLLAASNISNTPSGNLSASTVQAALNELQGDIDGITSNVTHTGEVTGATALTIHVSAISNKSLVTAASGDMLLVQDATDGALKRVNATDFLAGSGDVTNNYSSVGDYQNFVATTTGASEAFTVSSSNDIVTVTQNGQVLDESEFSLVGTTLTVTPDIGIETGDEILVSQHLFAVVTGGIKTNFTTKSSDYTITANDHTINCTSGTFTVTLPSAAGITGRMYVVKNVGAGTITVDADGTQTIDGSLTVTLNQYDSAMLQSDGANWIKLN